MILKRKVISALIIYLTFSSVRAFATEVYLQKPYRQKISIKIIKAEPQSNYLSPLAHYVFDLISDTGATHTLVCSERMGLAETKLASYFIFQNVMRISVGNFKISNHELCDQLAKYIEAVFELVSDSKPIRIILDTSKFEVESVYLPDLDPFMDRVLELPKAQPGKLNWNALE